MCAECECAKFADNANKTFRNVEATFSAKGQQMKQLKAVTNQNTPKG